LAGVRGRHCFVLWILNIGFQITRLPMHQGMAAMINFFAFVKGFAIWHERFLPDNGKAFNGFCARVYVSRMLTKKRSDGSGDLATLKGAEHFHRDRQQQGEPGWVGAGLARFREFANDGE
jgi:hypothetical protein